MKAELSPFYLCHLRHLRILHFDVPTADGKKEFPPMTQVRADHGDSKTYAIIGAAMEVHRVLGPGFLESIYHAALALEFAARGIAFQREVALPVAYKGHAVGMFRADFLCEEAIIVELKASNQVSIADAAQLINYLKAAGREIGLLLNFGVERLEYRRLIHSPEFSTESAPSADTESFLLREMQP
jgi:GxxExxY protein